MTTTNDMLEHYLASLSQEGSKNSTRTYAVRLCQALEGRAPDRQAVDAWLEQLKAERYAPGTIRYAFSIARRVFKVNNIPWPYQRFEIPALGERDEYRPSFSAELIDDMILATAKLKPHHRAYLALATTYGVRRQEIQEIGPHSFDWESGVIYVATAKHGRQRYHVVPDEIAEHLRVFTWPQTSLSSLSLVFSEIRGAGGISKEVGSDVGWHGIRRAVDRVLKDGERAPTMEHKMSSSEVATFMRWKVSSQNMVERYSSGVVIGREGPQVEMGIADETLDRKAFRLLPWLATWERVEARG